MLLDVSSHLSTEGPRHILGNLTPLFGGLSKTCTSQHLYVKETGFSITLKATLFGGSEGNRTPRAAADIFSTIQCRNRTYILSIQTHYSFRLPRSGDYLRCRLNPRGEDPIITTQDWSVAAAARGTQDFYYHVVDQDGYAPSLHVCKTCVLPINTPSPLKLWSCVKVTLLLQTPYQDATSLFGLRRKSLIENHYIK